MEVPAINSIYAKPLIRGKNQFYYVREVNEYVVMQRFQTVEDKPHKRFKTERGAINHAYHMNIRG